MWVCPTCDTRNVSSYEEGDSFELRCKCGFAILDSRRQRDERKREMKSTTRHFTLSMLLVLAVASGAGREVRAQTAQSAYSTMAPLDQYLMDRDAEIALARSAAPESISGDAKVLLLGRHGYETAVEGKNGFVCVVERSWAADFESPGFWNPRVRAPLCFNPVAARSILPLTVKRTDLFLAGASKQKVFESIKAALDSKEVAPPEPGAMAYMQSKLQYLNDEAVHWHPHLMFYLPQTDPASWGPDLPGSPVRLLPDFHGAPEPITAFMVLVRQWSDGTPEVTEHHGSMK